MDTDTPPKADSIAAAEMFYIWHTIELLREENERLSAARAKQEQPA